MLDVSGHEDRLAHVVHEQRGHAEVRKALLRLGEREVRETDRFAKEGAAGGARAIERWEGNKSLENP